MDLPEQDEPKLAVNLWRRLTDDERQEWAKRFQVRMTPDAMLALWGELAKITESNMLVQAGMDFMRNALTAADFAKVRGATEVRLWPDIRPDCELRLDGNYELFEVTEADYLRRRGDEYRELQARQEADIATGGDGFIVDYDPYWIERSEEAAAMLRRAAERKVRGNYDPSCGFVVYLNPPAHESVIGQVLACMRPATAIAKGKFREVWVLWQGTAYRTW